MCLCLTESKRSKSTADRCSMGPRESWQAKCANSTSDMDSHALPGWLIERERGEGRRLGADVLREVRHGGEWKDCGSMGRSCG